MSDEPLGPLEGALQKELPAPSVADPETSTNPQESAAEHPVLDEIRRKYEDDIRRLKYRYEFELEKLEQERVDRSRALSTLAQQLQLAQEQVKRERSQKEILKQLCMSTTAVPSKGGSLTESLSYLTKALTAALPNVIAQLRRGNSGGEPQPANIPLPPSIDPKSPEAAQFQAMTNQLAMTIVQSQAQVRSATPASSAATPTAAATAAPEPSTAATAPAKSSTPRPQTPSKTSAATGAAPALNSSTLARTAETQSNEKPSSEAASIISPAPKTPTNTTLQPAPATPATPSSKTGAALASPKLAAESHASGGQNAPSTPAKEDEDLSTLFARRAAREKQLEELRKMRADALSPHALKLAPLSTPRSLSRAGTPRASISMAAGSSFTSDNLFGDTPAGVIVNLVPGRQTPQPHATPSRRSATELTTSDATPVSAPVARVQTNSPMMQSPQVVPTTPQVESKPESSQSSKFANFKVKDLELDQLDDSIYLPSVASGSVNELADVRTISVHDDDSKSYSSSSGKVSSTLGDEEVKSVREFYGGTPLDSPVARTASKNEHAVPRLGAHQRSASQANLLPSVSPIGRKGVFSSTLVDVIETQTPKGKEEAPAPILLTSAEASTGQPKSVISSPISRPSTSSVSIGPEKPAERRRPTPSQIRQDTSPQISVSSLRVKVPREPAPESKSATAKSQAAQPVLRPDVRRSRTPGPYTSSHPGEVSVPSPPSRRVETRQSAVAPRATALPARASTPRAPAPPKTPTKKGSEREEDEDVTTSQSDAAQKAADMIKCAELLINNGQPPTPSQREVLSLLQSISNDLLQTGERYKQERHKMKALRSSLASVREDWRSVCQSIAVLGEEGDRMRAYITLLETELLKYTNELPAKPNRVQVNWDDPLLSRTPPPLTFATTLRSENENTMNHSNFVASPLPRVAFSTATLLNPKGLEVDDMDEIDATSPHVRSDLESVVLDLVDTFRLQ